MRIRLEKSEIDVVVDFAKRKQEHKDRRGIKSNRRSSYSEIEIQVIGTLGEVALAKHLGMEPQLGIYNKGDLYDLLYRGHRIEVKTSTTVGLKVYGYIAEKTALNTDLMVLMYVDKHRALLMNKQEYIDVEFVGYIPTALFFEKVLTDGKVINKPNYTMYTIPEDVLWNPDLFQDIDPKC